MEEATIKLFQVICETSKLNCCRAYATLTTPTGRSGAIRAAASVFFEARKKEDFEPVDELLKAYLDAVRYRNNIAHGIAVGSYDSENPKVHLGYFLSCPSHGPKWDGVPHPQETWWLGSKYFYRALDIDSCCSRFQELLDVTMRVTLDLNEKYDVVPPGSLHP